MFEDFTTTFGLSVNGTYLPLYVDPENDNIRIDLRMQTMPSAGQPYISLYSVPFGEPGLSPDDFVA